MLFRRDSRKDAANRKKHGIDFREAVSALDDTLATTFPDDDHSILEKRFLTIGMSSRRLLVVAHTEEQNAIRLISARRATRRERRYYEEGE